ncbi:MAG TPA: MoxR family ATPase [Blastocatellia bacterium]
MTSDSRQINTVEDVAAGFERFGYITDRALATAVFLTLKLHKPILIEGPAGVGKTEVARVLASLLATTLIRLQCYEGLDANSTIYEWNYQKQLLAIKIQEGPDRTIEDKEAHIFSAAFLLERPLLQSITARDAAPVLLIDEIDRSDEAFEAFLLELLSDFQITIPEMGTIKATHPPYVILTSNRTRELGDALKRRCLYHWISYPSLEKEMRIVHSHLPEISRELSGQVVRFVQTVRELRLAKRPGIVETLDCASAMACLGKERLDAEAIEQTLGCVLKSVEDFTKVKPDELERAINAAGHLESIPGGAA